MAVRMVGKEFLDFYGDDEFFQKHNATGAADAEILVNDKKLSKSWGPDDVKPSDKVVIVSGFVDWEGGGMVLEKFFKQWRKAQSTTSFLVTCPKEDYAEITDIVKTLGGKVLGGSHVS